MNVRDAYAREASPRTDAEPLAFTRTEFLAGTARAWGWTTLLLVTAWAVATGGWSLIVGTAMIGLASIPAVAVGAPGAYAIGRLLRRSPRVGAHLLVFALYGAAVGAVTTLIATPLITGDVDTAWVSRIFLLINVPLSAVGIGGAWFVTARRALLADAGEPPRHARPVDPDAAAEDGQARDLDERYRVIDPRQRSRRRHGLRPRQRPRG